MKKSLVTLLACSFAVAVGAVFFEYGSGPAIGPAGPLDPIDASFSPSLPQNRHPASAHPVFGQTSNSPGTKESPSGLPLTARRTSAAVTGSLTAASVPAAQDEDLIDAEPSSQSEASAGERSPNTLASQRKLAPLGVAVPLAFQDVDLFINTPQGLRYAPVDFNPASDAGGKAVASTTNATPVPGSPGTITVDEASAAMLEKMREDFVNQVGGLDQDADDPDYLKSWRNAQSLSDSKFRFLFGWQAFNNYQLAAAQKAEAEKWASAHR